MGTYKAITLGSASGFISNNNSFQNFTKLFKIPFQGMSLSVPSQPSNEDFGESGVTILAPKANAAAAAAAAAAAIVMKLPVLLRHKAQKYAPPNKHQIKRREIYAPLCLFCVRWNVLIQTNWTL